MSSSYTEDTLVQHPTANYLHSKLGWESVYAYNQETFGPDGTLGRASAREIVLTRYLHKKLREFNPGLPDAAYDRAVRTIKEFSTAQTAIATNRDKYALFKDGVDVSYRNDRGTLKKQRLRVFDFENPLNNHFLIVRELWIHGDLYRRRADIVGFVNGIPLLFIECKNIHKDLKTAFEKNFSDYRDTVPHLFHHNAIVMFGNGDQAKIGSITSKWEHFHEWKRLSEQEPGVVKMETLLKGVCDKQNFMDIFENFIVFDESSGQVIKILARNHQYLGVNNAIQALMGRKQRDGKLGVFWHTQGSGKSYSMVCFTRKVHRKLGGNYTFLICTDREDLDTQIYKTYAGCGLADNDAAPCRAESGEHLGRLLSQHKAYVFTLIQKFNQEIDQGGYYTDRDDVIVITDEAHRTQYGELALNMRDALPNASYIGFTGTPLFKDDEITRRVFGDYVSTYDFQRAVQDNSTVPLYYDARGEKLGLGIKTLNEEIAAKLEEIDLDDVNVRQRLERELARNYHIITADKRLRQVANDFVEHYSTQWENGKAMLVCIDKVTCVRMHNLITERWQGRIKTLKRSVYDGTDEREAAQVLRQIEWMEETRIAVVVSEEQGEVQKFRDWDLDIIPHRTLIKNGFDLPDGSRVPVDEAFKKPDHRFRVVIVCAMWLTGFDVPSLSTLYLDKPLKAHTLMQAIARANRVHEGKNNGLVVDYCGILKNLRNALAIFAGTGDDGRDGDGNTDPARPNEELLAELDEAIGFVREFLADGNAPLDAVITETGFDRNAAILAAKEAANQNDITRKRFGVLAREVFSKFKACINIPEVTDRRSERGAINIIYKSLQADRDRADISDIIRMLHGVIDEAIVPRADQTGATPPPYDISKIDFERLRAEFAKSPAQRTVVQNLRDVLENRLAKMLARNPARIDFQKRFEEIIDEYNSEKDRQTIEQTFQQLLEFMHDLNEDEERVIKSGLDEETNAIFELLKKDELSKQEIKRVKSVAVELLATLKRGRLQVDRWTEKESTRDAVRVAVQSFLWADATGLPSGYDDAEIKTRAEDIYIHLMRAYPRLPSPVFAEAS